MIVITFGETETADSYRAASNHGHRAELGPFISHMNMPPNDCPDEKGKKGTVRATANGERREIDTTLIRRLKADIRGNRESESD